MITGAEAVDAGDFRRGRLGHEDLGGSRGPGRRGPRRRRGCRRRPPPTRRAARLPASTRLKAPRGLNEPACWCSSSFSVSGREAEGPGLELEHRRPRTRPASRAAAASISAGMTGVTTTSAASHRYSARSPRRRPRRRRSARRHAAVLHGDGATSWPGSTALRNSNSARRDRAGAGEPARPRPPPRSAALFMWPSTSKSVKRVGHGRADLRRPGPDDGGGRAPYVRPPIRRTARGTRPGGPPGDHCPCRCAPRAWPPRSTLPASPVTETRRSAHRAPMPPQNVRRLSSSPNTGDGRDVDDDAPDHPAHLVVHPGVARVVVRHVLQVAGQGVEPQPPAGAGVAEPHGSAALEDPALQRLADQLLVGHDANVAAAAAGGSGWFVRLTSRRKTVDAPPDAWCSP